MLQVVKLLAARLLAAMLLAVRLQEETRWVVKLPVVNLWAAKPASVRKSIGCSGCPMRWVFEVEEGEEARRTYTRIPNN
jgi:hypothetical protein